VPVIDYLDHPWLFPLALSSEVEVRTKVAAKDDNWEAGVQPIAIFVSQADPFIRMNLII
jgi:hypothetical protein